MDAITKPSNSTGLSYLAKRRNNLLVRIPAVMAAAVALFWGIWYLITGNLPSVSAMTLSQKMTYQLPFVVSRLWDIPAAAVFAVLGVMIWYFTEKIEEKEYELSTSATIIILIIAVITPISALSTITVLVSTIIFTIIFAIFTLALAITAEKYNMAVYMAVCVAMGIVLAFGVGLGTAVVFGGVVGLAALVGLAILYVLVISVLVFSAMYAVAWLIRHRAGSIVRGHLAGLVHRGLDWLLAREAEGGNKTSPS